MPIMTVSACALFHTEWGIPPLTMNASFSRMIRSCPSSSTLASPLRDDEQVVGSVGVGRDGAAAVRGEIGDGAVYDLAAGSEQIFGQEIYVFGWCDESIFFIHIGIFLKLSGVFCPLFVEASTDC